MRQTNYYWSFVGIVYPLFVEKFRPCYWVIYSHVPADAGVTLTEDARVIRFLPSW